MRTPRETFDAALRAVFAWDADSYAELFAPDGVLEVPFAPDEWRPRVVRGRDEIHAVTARNMKRGKDAGRRMVSVRDVVLHEQRGDPATTTLIAEFVVDGVTASGDAYSLPYVHVYTIKDGLITSLRDYFSARTSTLATAHVAASLGQQMLDAMLAWDADAYGALFHDDAVLIHPFAPADIASLAPIRGRTAITERTKANMKRADEAGRRVVAFHDVKVHAGADPNVAVIELVAERRFADGASASLQNLWVLEAKDGRIHSLRDYFDTRALTYAAK